MRHTEPAAAVPTTTRRSRFSPRTVDGLDDQIVDLLFTLMDSFRGHLVAALESVGLPRSQGHLLMTLDEPIPMSDLARNLGFDASHITTIVDRLEERDLVERQTDSTDRRIKRIAITAHGAALQEQIRKTLFSTLPPLSRLTRAQREQLHHLLATAIEPSAAVARTSREC